MQKCVQVLRVLEPLGRSDKTNAETCDTYKSEGVQYELMYLRISRGLRWRKE